MSKRIRGLLGKLGGAITLVTYLLTGCNGRDIREDVEVDIMQNESLPVSEKDSIPHEEANYVKETPVIEETPAIEEVNRVKEQMASGLSNMEVIKIKEAFNLMIEDIENRRLSKKCNYQSIINDLESIYNVATYEPFIEDLLTMQRLLQHDLGSGGQTGQAYVKYMLNDLNFFGMDHPYNIYSRRVMGDYLELDTELTLNKATKTWG